MRKYIDEYLLAVEAVSKGLNKEAIEKTIEIILDIRNNGGRLFILGVGGGAGNASHAVNDFRKLVGIEAYAPTDNVSELTARINDDGWDSVFVNWLRGSKLNSKDCIFAISVGGGNEEKNISTNLVKALKKKGVIKKAGKRFLALSEANDFLVGININFPSYISFWSALNLRKSSAYWSSILAIINFIGG